MKSTEIVERIRKALRLARKAATEGERQAADNAARRMAKSYGIDIAEIEGETADADGGKAVVIDGKTVNPDAPEIQLAAWILDRHFSIAIAFEKVRGGKVKVLWFGNRINIGVAQYAWNIMVRESVKSYERMEKKPERGLFMRGFFFAIDYLLTVHPLRNDSDLAKAEKDAAKRKLEERKEEQEFKLKGTGKDGGDDGDAVIKGYKEGAKVRLNRPVGGSQTKRGGISATKTERIEHNGNR